MFDKLINRIGISLTLLFVIIELAWINSKSLLFLTNSSLLIDEVFCIIGAVAYSLVTVTVMRKTKSLVMRIIFPLFDIAFVFLGFNINQGGVISSDPVRFYLSVIVALFTGVIIFSLGLINAKDHIAEPNNMISETYVASLKDEIKLCEDVIRSLQDAIKVSESQKESIGTDLELVRSELVKIRGDCEVVQSENANLKTKIKLLETDFDMLEGECSKYKTVYLASERSRILKKNPENRTPEEAMILEHLTSN